MREIALSVGYMTPHTFKSNYARKYGVSPTEDRRRHQGRSQEFGCAGNPPVHSRYNSEIHTPGSLGIG
jgi:AraC-like DNA-binding protein